MLHLLAHPIFVFQGKRKCLGESIAESEIFTFLAGMIQKYQLLPVQPGHKYEINKPVLGLGLLPQQYEILVKRRDPGEGRNHSH